MRPLLVAFALQACGNPPANVGRPSAPATPTPPPAIVDCAHLAPCPPDLGVCLRCVSPDNPTWVWNAAPGSPWALRVRPHLLPDPTPGLDLYVGYPFAAGPDCSRLEFDARGLPVRTLPRPTSERAKDAYAWTYDARGRVIEQRVDRVPTCGINSYGDEGPCGVPDGTWDRVTTYRWRDLARGGSIMNVDGWSREYDARGRLVRMTPPKPDIRTTDVRQVEHEYRDDRLVATRTNAWTSRLVYDTAGHVVEREIVNVDGSKHTTMWAYDTNGNVTSAQTAVGALEYANTYRQGRLVSVRSSSRGNIHMSPPIAQTTREHDAHGFLVREVTSDPGVRVMAEQRWTRDERGVPLAKSGGGPGEDYRCLARLADRFLSAPIAKRSTHAWHPGASRDRSRRVLGQRQQRPR